MPKTRVHLGSNGQYKVTVPKGIAEGMSLDGKRLEWDIKSGSTIQLKVKDE